MAAKVAYAGSASGFIPSTIDQTKELLVFEVDPGNTTKLLEDAAQLAVTDGPLVMAALQSHNIWTEITVALKIFADLSAAGA